MPTRFLWVMRLNRAGLFIATSFSALPIVRNCLEDVGARMQRTIIESLPYIASGIVDCGISIESPGVGSEVLMTSDRELKIGTHTHVSEFWILSAMSRESAGFTMTDSRVRRMELRSSIPHY